MKVLSFLEEVWTVVFQSLLIKMIIGYIYTDL